jgi:TP901 family phage tail tape measure protein
MANTIDIVVQAHDRASKQLAAVGNRAQGLGDKLRKMRGPLLGVTAAIGGLGFFAVKTFASFEQQMARAGAVSKASASELVQLTDIAKEMGRTTQFTASQAAEALTFMSMAGMDVNTQMEALPKVLQLAAAGSLDLGQAADIVTNVMAGFGLEANQLGMANDVLTTAFTNANTDLSQLGEAFKMAGPVAKAAGLSFNETTAALAQMGNAGFQGSLAGTALRGAITRLLNPVGKAKSIIKDLGLEVTDSQGKFLPFVDIVGQLEKSGMTAGQAMQVFGQRAGPAMLALVSQGSGALEELIGKMEDSGGTAEAIAAKQLATLQGSFLLLKSAVEGVMIEIGTALSPTLRSVAGVLTKVASVIAGLNPFVLKMGVGVIALVGAFALLGLAIPPIIAGFTLMALTPIGGVITAIALALAALAFLFIKHKDTIREFALHMVTVLGSAAISVAQIFDRIAKSILSNVANIIIEFANLARKFGMGGLADKLQGWAGNVLLFGSGFETASIIEDIVARLVKLLVGQRDVGEGWKSQEGALERMKAEAKDATETVSDGLKDVKDNADEAKTSVEGLTTALGNMGGGGGGGAGGGPSPFHPSQIPGMGALMGHYSASMAANQTIVPSGGKFAEGTAGFAGTYGDPAKGLTDEQIREGEAIRRASNYAITGQPPRVNTFNEWDYDNSNIYIIIDGKEMASSVDPHHGDNANSESNNRS